MSTNAIRTALAEAIECDEDYAECCEREGRPQEARSVRDRVARAKKAQAEVESIEKAAADLERLSIGDFTYNIRDRESVTTTTPDGQSTWEHTDVRAWSDASRLMAAIARQKESK